MTGYCGYCRELVCICQPLPQATTNATPVATNQYALGYAQAKADAVKVCRDEADSIDKTEVFLSRSHCLRIVADAIAALPIPGEEK